jgi:hypothetical protein
MQTADILKTQESLQVEVTNEDVITFFHIKDDVHFEFIPQA